MKKGITLIGMPGSGKSTLGKLLARDLKYKFIDLDELILKEVSLSPHDYMIKNGEQGLLELEEKLTMRLDFKNKIFSPGGSIVFSRKAMEKLKKETMIIYLKVDLKKLKSRIKNIDTRAIIGLTKFGFDKLFKIRSPLYEAGADITIKITNESSLKIKDKILSLLKEVI